MTMLTLLKLFLMLALLASVYRFIKIASDWDISLGDSETPPRDKKKK